VNGKLSIVGLGPGNQEFLLPVSLKVINDSDILIGGKRNLEPFRDLNKELVEIDHNLELLYDYIVRQAATKKIAVLVSGDPGIFSIQKLLRQKIPGIEIETLPGLSALQYFCGKLGINWDDLRIVSLHGRNTVNLADELCIHPRICVFTGGINSPDAICRRLNAFNTGNVMVTVGERLSYPEERIIKGDLERISGMEFGPLTMMLLERETVVATDGNGFETSGWPDDFFTRGETPITKEEIRAVSLAKLRLRLADIVYDIGAGTGSVTVETAWRCKNGWVYALEKNPQAGRLVLDNVRRFGLANVQVVNGEAPAALAGLPEPDRVFIGGSGGKLPEIVAWLSGLKKGLRVVINSVTLETTGAALASLTKNGFDHLETVTVSIARSRQAGAKHFMKAVNPVTIISAEKGDR